MPEVFYTRSIPVKYDVDVFVAGGGPAGMAAAVTAAKRGARVFLAEGQSCFGGMGTSAGMMLFLGISDGVNLTSAGFGSEVYERLRATGEVAPEHLDQPLGPALRFNPEALKRVYDELATEAGVRFSFLTSLLDVESEDGRLTLAICGAKSGLFAVRARVFGDATGDGDLCARAGAPYEKGDAQGAMQPPTLLSLWCDIDWEAAGRAGCHYGDQQEKQLPQAIADGIFREPDYHLPGLFQTGPHAGWGNCGHLFGCDGTDEVSLTAALVRGRRLALEYGEFYRRYLTGFERMQLLGTGALPGVRETRRICGDYCLSVEDYVRRATFEDEIGRFHYSIDVHASQPGRADFEQSMREYQQTYRYRPGENYGLPYRMLLPQGLHNVLMAGRCVSCDRKVHGSLRVMPGCFVTGQAAGMAAAIAAAQDGAVRKVDLRQLQQALRQAGAYLPNAG